MRWIAVPLGVVGCLLVTVVPGSPASGLGLLLLMIGALAFIRANRLAAAQREEQRHQEMLTAIKQAQRVE